MKKFLALFLAIIIAITLVSCLDQKDTPTPAPDGGDASTTTTTTTAKDNTPKKPLGYSTPLGDEGGEPPIEIIFSSLQDIQPFILAANGSKELFVAYANEKNLYPLITQEVAQAVTHNLGLIRFPLMSSKVSDENFGATYDLDHNLLDVVYIVGSQRYRFVYYFDENTIPNSERPIYKENAALGEFSLDLYTTADNTGLFGFYTENSILVRVMINTYNLEAVRLDAFNMSSIDNVK